jgi:hypothetical protein
MSRKWMVNVGVLVAIGAGLFVASRSGSDEPVHPSTTTTEPKVTSAELAQMPSQLPVSILPGLIDLQIQDDDDRRTISMTLSRARDDRETIAVLADQLRARGWSVRPNADGSHALIGYDWEGDMNAISADAGGGVRITLRGAAKSG